MKTGRYCKNPFKNGIILLFLVFLFSGPTQALWAGAIDDDKNFVVAPLVVSNPSFGTGTGVTGMYFFRPNEKDTKSPKSFIQPIAIYSNTDSYLLGLTNMLYLNKDRFRLQVSMGRVRINNDFNNHMGGRAKFTNLINGMQVRFSYRFAQRFFIGALYSISDKSYDPDDRETKAYLKSVDAEDTTTSGMGPTLTYDSRDSQHYPHSGIFSEIKFLSMLDAIGSDEEYDVLEGEFNNFYQYIPGHTLATRVYGRFTSSSTPYGGLSKLGQRNDLRGYTAGEYVAENLISAQIEYRWQLTKRWGLVGFAGIADLYDGSIRNTDTDNLFTSGGFGIRYMLQTVQRINFRVDFAFGEGDNDGVYVSIKEAF